VRELKNAMHRLATLVLTPVVAEHDLAFLLEAKPVPHVDIAWPDEDLPSALARLEKHLIQRALERCRGNRAEAARLLNIRRQHLYTRMEQYGLVSSERTPIVPSADDEP
jgi:DNA-binding NtrC family response regulator